MATALNPEYLQADRLAEAAIPSSILVFLATIVWALRVIARISTATQARWGLDDWLISAVLALLYTLFIIGLACARYGLFKHVGVPSTNLITFFQMVYAFQALHIVATGMVKLSVLAFYKRIFAGKNLMRTVNILFGIVSVLTLAFVLMGIFSCTPIQSFWTSQRPVGQCLDFKDLTTSYAAVNFTTDLLIWVMPLPTLWRLHLPIGQRLSLIGVFMLGLFDCAAVLMRFFATIVVIGSSDPTWDFTAAYVWSIVELSVGLMVASFPTIRVVIVAMIPRSWGKAFTRSSDVESSATPLKTRSWPRTNAYHSIAAGGPTGSSRTIDDKSASRSTDHHTGDFITISHDTVVSTERVRPF